MAPSKSGKLAKDQLVLLLAAEGEVLKPIKCRSWWEGKAQGSFMMEVDAFLKEMSCPKRPFNVSLPVDLFLQYLPQTDYMLWLEDLCGGLFPEDHICTFPFNPQTVNVLPAMCRWCCMSNGRTKPRLDRILSGCLVCLFV